MKRMKERSVDFPPEDLFTIITLCKKQHRGAVGNRFKNSIVPAQNAFGIVLPHSFEENGTQLKGSITWGDSGFNFKVTAYSKEKVLLRWNAHKKFDLSAQETETMILEFLKFVKNKVMTRELGIKVFARGKYPRLEAIPYEKKHSDKSDENIQLCYEAQLFDAEFKKFVLNHADFGVRCKGRPK